MVENGTCKDHRMVCSDLDDLKKKNPVSSNQMWAIVVLFIMVSMAIIGWLWQGQLSVRDRLENYQTTLTGISSDGKEGILIRMDKKLDKAIGVLENHISDDQKEVRK